MTMKMADGHVLAEEGRLPGSRAAAVVARDDRVMSPSLTRPYPLVIARGQGARVWDVDGNEFLDMTCGIAVTATGHCHPKVVAAIQRQAEQFIHMAGTDFYYEVEVDLAERLTALAPGRTEKRVFFTNSGTEAVEAAFKLARFTTRRHHVLAFSGSFHGRTMGALSLTGSKSIQRAGFGPLVPGVAHAPFPNPYRPPLGSTAATAAAAVLHFIENDLFGRVLPPEDVAAVFVEPFQGEGGYVVPPPDFLPGLRRLCDRHDILLVADEVQTGVGRTGRWWAVDHYDVVPDILCLAKGIASGMPLGAMVARADLMTWEPGAHGNTFGGNPVACAAAMATLDVIEEEGLLAHASALGEHFLDGLHDIAARHEAVGDVRGVGLWLAVDLVEDRQSKTPAKLLRDDVVERAFEHRVLLLGAGPGAVRFMPPLNVSTAEVDEALGRFERALEEAVAAR
jgi:4-aminobutyrate aminotransferase